MNRKKLFWRDVKDKDHYRSVFGEKPQGGFLRQRGADYEIVEVEVEKEVPELLKEYKKLETGPKVGKDTTPNYYFFKLPAESDYEKATRVDSGVVDRFRDQMTPFQEEKYPAEERKRLMNGKPGLPVFFYKDASGKIMELGFCRYFRLQYKYSPYDLAWPDEEMRDVEDITRGIFGYAGKAGKSADKSLAGRVAVGALVLKGNEYMPGKGLEVILGGPKPTCVPFYLQQDLKEITTTKTGDKKNNLKDMVNYNNKSAKLRGRKLYWHHNPDLNYLGSIEKKSKKVVSLLHPLSTGAHGTFYIHINNLSDSELGCLLEALELKRESAHKLGMGRPLGLGSVRVRIKRMNVENTAQKYSSLSARLGNTERPEMSVEEREKLREKFRNRVFEAVKEAGAAGAASQYYQLEAIKDLFMILDWKRQPEPSEVEYMTLKEYMKNAVLPDPENVRTNP